MVAFNMLRLIHNLPNLNSHTTAWNICFRGVSNKNLFEKLGLPEKPKKPLSPFLMFLENSRPHIKKKYPNASVLETAQIASKMWHQADESEKKKLKEEYHQERERYKLQLEIYQKSLSPEQKEEIKEAEADIKAIKDKKMAESLKKKKIKELQKPKQPISAFLKFALENKDSSSKFGAHMKEMREKWLKLPEASREKYQEMFKKERETFEKDLELWEIEMIKQGHMDLVRAKTLKNKMKTYL